MNNKWFFICHVKGGRTRSTLSFLGLNRLKDLNSEIGILWPIWGKLQPQLSMKILPARLQEAYFSLTELSWPWEENKTKWFIGKICLQLLKLSSISTLLFFIWAITLNLFLFLSWSFSIFFSSSQVQV